MNFYQKIFNQGIFEHQSGVKQNRIKLFNYLLFYSFLMDIPMMIWMALIGLPWLFLEVLVLSLVNFLCWFILKKQKADFAAVIFNLVYGIHNYFLAIISPESGTKHFAFALGIVPFILLKRKNLAIALFCFWLILYYFLDPLAEMISFKIILESSVSHAIELTMFTFVMLFIFFSVLHFKVINQRFSEELIESGNQLQKQKQLIETAHLEMKDSIQYAKRIQTAILPPISVLNTNFPENFVLYQPKDIVSGDFYWHERINDINFIAVADCTGHGVPGALVSVMCSNALNRSVREFELNEPSDILNKTRELIVNEFNKSVEIVQDGMDISLCAISKGELSFCGANNPLWLIRNDELIEIKGNKQPVGYYEQMTQFVQSEVEIQINDIIYLLTDGFADQFGGEKGKKYKYAQLKKFLLSIKNEDMQSQQRLLHKEFNDWKKDLEQIDDVCIIGIKMTSNNF